MKLPRAFAPVLTWALVAAATIVAYFPGLYGGFLFDDYANLPSLGASGPIDNWPAFWRYVTSGTADPTGRPIALLSFLIDAHDWPTSPLPFKRTNLILHLLNGLLLFGLLRALGTALVSSAPSKASLRMSMAATIGAGLWLLHPLFVSTTLYIVQREAMLPVLFTLAGLLAWLQGRRAFGEGRILAGVSWLTLGLGTCTLLAFFSKANGILLPALALALEFALPAPVTQPPNSRPRRLYRLAMTVLAGIPTMLVAGYLLYRGWDGLTQGISVSRPWTLAQRLLTEPRILIDYLELLWWPRPFTPGLFNDTIHVSTGWWSPPATLPSLLALVAIIGIAIGLRRRLPAVSAAILFFLVGQSIESSTVPLELYFEHRNYLPALLMFWPLALWLCDVPQSTRPVRAPHGSGSLPPMRRRHLKAGLAVALLAGLTGMTYARASLWGDTHDQALVWAKLNPTSPRAQAYAAQMEMIAGQPAKAVARLGPLLASAPDEVQLSLNLLGAECRMGRVRETTLRTAAYSLENTRNPGSLLEHWFERAMDQSAHPACPEMSLDMIGRLLAAASANPRLMSHAGRRQDIRHLQGSIALRQGDPTRALELFNLALDEQVRASAALKQAAQLGTAGYPVQALAHLDHYQTVRQREHTPGRGMARIHTRVLESQRYWDRELVRLRNTLLADQHARDPSPR